MEDFYDLFLKLTEATRNHEQYRDQECINMIASEGIKSPAVKEMQAAASDLEGRYAEGDNDLQGHVKKRYYQGQKFMSPIEDYATDLMKSLFKCNWADTRLVSGTHANLATFKGLSLATKNRKMVVTPLSCGAHISHDYTGLAGAVLGIENISHVYEKRNEHRRTAPPTSSAPPTRHRNLRRQPQFCFPPHPEQGSLRRRRRLRSLRSSHDLGLLQEGLPRPPP
jgi:glycine/serine hydroxymethyltransferase